MTKNSTKKIPRLRFKGFEGEWEEKRLEDISEMFSGGTPKINVKKYYNGKIPFIKSGEINSYTTDVYISKDGLINSSAKMVNKGNILYALYGATSGEVGLSHINGAINQAVLSINLNENYCDMYLYELLKYKKASITNKYLQGGQGNLSSKIIKSINLFYPLLKEQQKIGSFFAKLDQLIDLQSKKVEQLKKLKRGYLQKMFPQKGESVPRLRFYGFSGEWEYKKISDISVSFSGGTPNISVTSYYNGEIPFIRSGEIDSKNTKINISEEGLKNSSAKLVDKGTILYALYGANSGEVSISKINGAINQAILAIKVNDYCNNIYIYNLLSYKKNYIVRKYLQGGQGNLSGKIINSLLLNIPQKQEQQKMGLFFNKLDQLINLQSQKEYNLRKIKQSYFQRLFI